MDTPLETHCQVSDYLEKLEKEIPFKAESFTVIVKNTLYGDLYFNDEDPLLIICLRTKHGDIVHKWDAWDAPNNCYIRNGVFFSNDEPLGRVYYRAITIAPIQS